MLAKERHARLTSREPRAHRRRLERDVHYQQPFQLGGIGVLERGDVALEQLLRTRLVRMRDALGVRGALLQRRPGTLQGALHRRRRGVEHRRDVPGRKRQHLS